MYYLDIISADKLNSIKENAVRLSDIFRRDGVFPIYKEAEKENWTTTKGDHWMEGFLPGLLWNLYLYTNDLGLKMRALELTRAIMEKRSPLSHDIGFKFYYSTTLAWKITGIQGFKIVSIERSKELLNLFDDNLGFFPLGEDFVKYFPGESDDISNHEFIIDTMMASLPLILWTWSITGDRRYRDAALHHAHKTFDLLIRKDGSTFQAVRVDPNTLEIFPHTHQGFADDGCWARGQAWAIYGYAIVYQYTNLKIFLRIAEKLASYFLENLPSDLVTFNDFKDPKNPKTSRETSASAIAASALITLYQLSANRNYIDTAIEIIKILLKDHLTNGGLTHSKYRENEGNNAEVIFGDYYLLEALLKLQEMQKR